MKTTFRCFANWLLLFGLILLLPEHPEAHEYTLIRSPILDCLTLTHGESSRVEYPEGSLKRNEGGKITVDLIFESGDTSPKIVFLDAPQFKELVIAVENHVSRFRVPCMKFGDDPVRMRQHYVFAPNSQLKVTSSSLRDLADEKVEAQLKCIEHVKAGSKPKYPGPSLRASSSGNYFVELRFDKPDRAPEIKWLAEAKDELLKASVADFLAGLRMPCLVGTPVSTRFLYKFKLLNDPWEEVDEAPKLIPDMKLINFLRSANELRKPVSFNFELMSCPFNLRIEYRRPYVPSIVTEPDDSNSERKPFMDWLSLISLKLTTDESNLVLGSTFTLSIPCGTLNL